MALEFCKTLISKAAKTFRLNSLLFFGGEPLLAIDSLITSLKTAKDVQIPQTYLITNGNPLHSEPLPSSSIFTIDETLNPDLNDLFYFRHRIHRKEKEELRKIAELLTENHLYSAEFSFDVFHHEFLDPEETIELASQLKDLKAVRVLFSPRYLTTSRESRFDSITEKMIDHVKEMGFTIAAAEKIKPRGNALRNLTQYFQPMNMKEPIKCPNNLLFSNTDSLTNVCISPVGEIIVCDNIIVGSGTADTIVQKIWDCSFTKDPFLEILREGNIQGLLNLAESNGIYFDKSKAYHVCDICTKLRKALSINNICDI